MFQLDDVFLCGPRFLAKKMFSFVEKNMKLFHTGPRRRSKTGEVFPVQLLFDDVFCSIVLTHRHLIV